MNANSAGDLRDEDAAQGADMLRQRKTKEGELERSVAQTIEKLENGHAAGLAQRESRAVRRARGLGWFSVAAGALQIVAPRAALSMAGVRIRPQTARAMRLRGLRELASGVGILSNKRPAAWLWARVAGDAMDLALIGKTLASPKGERAHAMTALGSVLGVAALDIRSAIEWTRDERRGFAAPEGIQVLCSITVNRPRDEVYRYFRDLEHLPSFMSHLESVKVQNGRSKWRARGPLGIPIEWEAEIVADQPNQNLAWRSCEGSDVPNQGSVRFLDAPGGRGTEVRVELCYDPPTGALGAAAAKLFGAEPGQEIADDLRRLKQIIETGEVLRSDAGIHPRPPSTPPSKALRDGDRGRLSARASRGRRRSGGGKGRQVVR